MARCRPNGALGAGGQPPLARPAWTAAMAGPMAPVRDPAQALWAGARGGHAPRGRTDCRGTGRRGDRVGGRALWGSRRNVDGPGTAGRPTAAGR